LPELIGRSRQFDVRQARRPGQRSLDVSHFDDVSAASFDPIGEPPQELCNRIGR
jgi:hypothetical protein